MTNNGKKLTEQDGKVALIDHLIDKAHAARAKYGTPIDYDLMLTILEDRELVRYPVQINYDAAPLQPGEFAYAQPNSNNPKNGYTLYIHPHFENQTEALPLLIAYHLVRINYGDIADFEEAEQFGAALLGLEQEDYYEQLCILADSIPHATI